MIIDPGIKVSKGYKPYDDGIAKGVFVKVSLSVICIVCYKRHTKHIAMVMYYLLFPLRITMVMCSLGRCGQE